jgi:hypothetical protein
MPTAPVLTSPRRPVGILYEHPEWFKPLFEELERRGIPFELINADRLRYDPAITDLDYSLVLNRMSPSSWLRNSRTSAFATLDFLLYLEDIGVPVINGSEAYGYEISKARQLRLLERLDVAHPRARVINHPAEAAEAAEAADGLTYPVLIKPNIGGSGAGITSFDTPDALRRAAEAGELEFGPDDTALVQEHLTPEGDAIVRVEFLDGQFLYAIRISLMPNSFNLCPADYCGLPGVADGVSGRGLPIEGYRPPESVIEEAGRLLTATGADLGGVEYPVDAKTGRPHFYDINALSNFVADAPNVVGFDPFVNLVDFIAKRVAAGEVVRA